MSKLREIFAHKRNEVAAQQATISLAEMQAEAATTPPPRDFIAALRQACGRPALIAEIKRRSPSRGLLVADFDPLRLARIYADNGATAISVLTDETYFGGSLDHLRAVAAQMQDGRAQGLPVLRKDFICDPYQVYQACAAGADAILLIVAALPSTLLAELLALAHDLGMAALVEVHDEAELEIALGVPRPADRDQQPKPARFHRQPGNDPASGPARARRGLSGRGKRHPHGRRRGAAGGGRT